MAGAARSGRRAGRARERRGGGDPGIGGISGRAGGRHSASVRRVVPEPGQRWPLVWLRPLRLREIEQEGPRGPHGETPLRGLGVLSRGRGGRPASERDQDVSQKDVALPFVTSVENLSFYMKMRV